MSLIDEFGKSPLNHVERPRLPWRSEESSKTECGLPADSYATISRDELAAQAKRLGRERLAIVTCMTCLHSSQRWPSWEENPVGALGREMNQMRGPSDGFRNELLTIAALIEAHRSEFEEMLAGLDDVVRLSDKRTSRRAPRGRH